MTALWTATEAAKALGIAPAAGAEWSADGVSIDTRSVAPGDLFVALKGPRFDAHAFAATALSSGAVAALVDHPVPGVDPGRLLIVADSQAGLEALAAAARARSTARFVAVTGSVGKTGTKEALAKVLAAQGSTHASAGNLNNQIGMPLSLARMPAGARFGVFELGMNHAGEIRPLSRLLQPDVAIVTTIEAVHLAHFDSVDGIADAKAEVFEGMRPEGTAILNRDNPHFERLAGRARDHGLTAILSFGASPGSDATLKKLIARPEGSQVEAVILGRTVGFKLPLPGLHHAQNALAVLLAVAAVDADVDAAATALADLAPVTGRGTASEIFIQGGSFRLIDESYNASPAAIRAALSVLAMTEPGPGGRRLVVFGDMLELGIMAPAEHGGLAAPIAAAGVSLVFTAGALMEYLHKKVPAGSRGAHAEDSGELAEIVAAAVRPGDVVLVKGSAGARMGTVVSALRALNQAQMETRPAI